MDLLGKARRLESTIARLEAYTHMSDFGTCAVDWPLMDDWEEELARGELDYEGPHRKTPLP